SALRPGRNFRFILKVLWSERRFVRPFGRTNKTVRWTVLSIERTERKRRAWRLAIIHRRDWGGMGLAAAQVGPQSGRQPFRGLFCHRNFGSERAFLGKSFSYRQATLFLSLKVWF